MKLSYIAVPTEISSAEVASTGLSLSPSQYKRVVIPNPSVITVRDFLRRDLKRSDLGIEVGSINYIRESPNYFFRTKGLQPHSFLPDITPESLTPVNPKAFKNHHLKQGDFIISKDSNIGEAIILDRDYPNWMLCGALYKLPVKKWKYYLLAFVKHACFREQLDILVPMSATIRHAKTRFLECKVPLPNTDTEDVIDYVEKLTIAVINKEKEIRIKHAAIQSLIRRELQDNQKTETFKFDFPSFDELRLAKRIDTNLFQYRFKQQAFLIRNYKGGYKSIEQFDFDISRGQNLQVSCIGDSIYSENPISNFYTLMLPKHLSRYGTVDTVQFLGNKNKLKTVKKGNLIFGAEGFEKGRSIVITDDSQRTITNIHGITLNHNKGDITNSIFIKCFLDYLRHIGLVDLYAVGGNGGSLAMKYWDVIPFPVFPDQKQEEIATLYHNPNTVFPLDTISVENFISTDESFNQSAGIVELDKTAKRIKHRINEVIDNIVQDEPVNMDFSFLS